MLRGENKPQNLTFEGIVGDLLLFCYSKSKKTKFFKVIHQGSTKALANIVNIPEPIDKTL